MRILYFGNNWVGLKVLEWLIAEGEQVVGLVIHPKEKQKYGNEILSCLGIDFDNVFSLRLWNTAHRVAFHTLKNFHINFSESIPS